jgi:hypothetical protein
VRARLILVIEVSTGGTRRYFTEDGEPIGEGAPANDPERPMTAAEAKPDEEPMSVRDIIGMVPRKRIVPPFDPSGIPVLRNESDEASE